MPRKTNLFLLLSALLLTTCKSYDQRGPVESTNGLSCQNYTNYGFYVPQARAECFYVCPDGTIRQPDIPGKFSASSPLYSSSKEDLDLQFCGMAASQPAPTQAPASASPPPAASTAPPTIQASPTAEISLTPQPPLLTGAVPMCDVGGNLMNLRIAEPAPVLTGKTLTVQIADMASTCAVNPVNPSLLGCTIPVGVIFPARIVVSLDSIVVNDFIFDGSGCAKLTTPIPGLISTP